MGKADQEDVNSDLPGLELLSRGEGASELERNGGTSELDAGIIEFAPDPGPDWRLPNEFHLAEAEQYADKLGVDLAVASRLLKMKHYGGELQKYKRWLDGSRSLIASPEKTVPGMSAAASAVLDAIHSGDEPIAVFCDYDVDGLTAGEVLRRGLSEKIDPDRLLYCYAEGKFGLTNEFVDKAAAEGAKLLITLDCGSSQTEEIGYAQSLGLKTIVVDHHAISGDNPADFHLNPHLSDPPSSANTGAQLSWKLIAAIEELDEGEISEEHYQERLNLAGLGALADMGSVMLPENRAFFWGAADKTPIGIVTLAEKMDEDPHTPGGMVRTVAALNLPKRTPAVSCRTTAALIAASDAASAAPLAEEISAAHAAGSEARVLMTADALTQTGVAKWNDGRVTRPSDDRISVARIEDPHGHPGYSGVVAGAVARKTGRPAIVFTKLGKDAAGAEIYKFSFRPSGVASDVSFGELIDNPLLQEACQIHEVDQTGKVQLGTSLGGHKANSIVSGNCLATQVKEVTQIVEDHAGEYTDKRYWRKPWNGADAYLEDRRVGPERLRKIESEARRIGPFSQSRQMVSEAQVGKPEQKWMPNRAIQISVVGTLGELSEDPEIPEYYQGEITLTDGSRRDVRYPREHDEAAPVGKMCEWLLNVNGSSSPYFLRKFYQPGA